MVAPMLRNEHIRLAPAGKFKSGNLTVDVARFEVRVDGRPVDLTPREFALFLYLAQHPGAVHDAESLAKNAWPEYGGAPQAVRVCMHRLRKKLANSKPWRIKTVWTLGYRFTSS